MIAGEWIYRFGDVEVEPAAHRITRQGADLGVEPKAFAVLVALLEQSGKALERDDLLDRVWGHRHVTPGVLNRVVAQLRKALGDDAEHPRYIQTLHSLGYRFIGEVERVPAQVPPREESEPVSPREFATSEPDESTATAPGTKWSWPLLATCVGIIVALAWLIRDASSPTHRPHEASIAVLPFTSLSSDQDDRYFAEGLAVEMHDALAGVQGLKVAARTTPAAAELRTPDIKATCARLGVASLLDASVRRDGERLRINARLSDCSTGFTLWSRRYDRRLTDVFAIQNEIAEEVVGSLVGVLPDVGKGLKKRLMPTSNFAAFDAYLRGLQAMLHGGDAAAQAVGYFQQALSHDKGFARAQAGICRVKIREFENLDDADAYNDAAAACRRARDLDPTIAEVDLALGDLNRVRGDLARALEHYRKVEGDTALGALANVGMARTYAAQGRGDLALKHFQQALELSPGNAFIHSEIGYQQYLDERYPDAIASFRKAVTLQPGDAGLWSALGSLYMAVGDNVEGARALERSIAIRPGSSALTNLGLIKLQAGDYSAAVALQRKATQLDPQHYLLWANLADALLADSQPAAQVLVAWQEAASRAERYLAIRPDDSEAVAGLGLYRAHLGDEKQARALVMRADSLQDDSGQVALLNAETMALLGDPDEARRYLAIAREAGIPDIEIDSNRTLRSAGLLSTPAKADESTTSQSTARSNRQGHTPGG